MKRAGIYIHIPFCRSRCSYCDFATGMYESGLAERYVRAVEAEIASFAGAERRIEADTIYFGGGTPSLLTPTQVERILRAIRAKFTVAADAEVTMEMNPGTVTPESLAEFRRLGINRASFGVQTFDDEQLRRLGRSHTAADARRTYTLLGEAGFDNISFDLIAGLPGQTLAAWARNLEEALRMRPAHLSLYLLEIHENTPLAAQIRRGAQPQPDDDLAAEMYRLMLDQTAAAGYEHYELSNFCQPGRASRHNMKYWTGAPVYGFGCAAHSYDGAWHRWANERDTRRYVELIEAFKRPIVETTELDLSAARSEALFLGLRLMRGVDLNELRARFGSDVREEYASDLARLSAAGLIELDGAALRLTRAGALLANEVFAVFV
jgi:oxygen-independent coproporphyrinogen-3 oxidase